MFEKFCCEIRMFGRRFRVDENDDIYSLNDQGHYGHWHKLKKKMRWSKGGKPQTNRGMIVQFMAFEDRYNQYELGRCKSGDYPPRTVACSIFYAIKYLSNGVDLGCKGYFVNHKDGNVLNDSPDNLEWVLKENLYKKKNSNRFEVGCRIGCYTVLECLTKKEYHVQAKNDVDIGYLKVKCDCGNVEEVRGSYVLYGQRRLCCSECNDRYAKGALRDLYEEFGLTVWSGFRDKRKRRKMKVNVIPKDWERESEFLGRLSGLELKQII